MRHFMPDCTGNIRSGTEDIGCDDHVAGSGFQKFPRVVRCDAAARLQAAGISPKRRKCLPLRLLIVRGRDQKDGRYLIVTDRWQKYTQVELTEQILDELSGYCDEFLVHAVDVEGKADGIEPQVAELLGNWGRMPVTYAGGVHSFEDLRNLKRLGRQRDDGTVRRETGPASPPPEQSSPEDQEYGLRHVVPPRTLDALAHLPAEIRGQADEDIGQILHLENGYHHAGRGSTFPARIRSQCGGGL